MRSSFKCILHFQSWYSYQSLFWVVCFSATQRGCLKQKCIKIYSENKSIWLYTIKYTAYAIISGVKLRFGAATLLHRCQGGLLDLYNATQFCPTNLPSASIWGINIHNLSHNFRTHVYLSRRYLCDVGHYPHSIAKSWELLGQPLLRAGFCNQFFLYSHYS